MARERGGILEWQQGGNHDLGFGGKELKLESTSSSSQRGMAISVSIASATLAFLSIAGITLVFRRRQRNKLHASPDELGPKPWERREADGSVLVPVRHELEESRPAVHEIGGG